jgi:hypothetical protein
MADFLLDMSSEVLANLLNTLLADEDMAPGISDVIDDLNAQALGDFVMALDQQILADFLNDILADDALGTWVGQLLPNLDTQHLASLLNQLLTDEYHELSAWIADLTADLGTEDLATFLGFVTSEQDLIDWVDDLFHALDPNTMADFMGPIVAQGFMGPILVNGSPIPGALDALLSDPVFEDQVGELLNTLDHTLYNTLYPDLWIHALIPAFSLTIFGVPLTFNDLDTWIAINCIYYGPYGDRPAAPGYPNPWPEGGYW